MGRGAQLYDFLVRDEMLTKLQRKHRYTSLTITDDLKKFRRKWRKDNLKPKQNELFAHNATTAGEL